MGLILVELGKVGMQKKGFSLVAKLAVTLTLCGVCLCAVATMHTWRSAHTLQAQFHESTLAKLTSIAKTVRHSLDSRSSLSVNESLDASIRQGGVVSAMVLDGKHVVLARANMPELSPHTVVSPDLFDSVVTGRLNTGELQVISVPLLSVADGLTTHSGAVLLAAVDTQPIVSAKAALWRGLQFAIISLLVIILAAVFAIYRWVAAPVRRIEQTLSMAANTGNFAATLQEQSSSELVRLSMGLTDFLSKVRSRELHLERRVRQRSDELKRLSEDLKFRALHDPLSRLPNRSMLEDDIVRAAASADRKGHYFSVLMLDLDDFKTFNDSFGHDFGDQLLKAVAAKLQNNLRGEDRVYRYGGDEFVAIVEGLTSMLDVETIAKTILKEMRNDIQIMGRNVVVSVSIGASVYPKHGRTLSELIHNADCAMCAAKESGKDNFVVYHEGIEDNDSHTDWIVKDLPKAMSNNELLVYYQPNVKVENGVFQIVGAEALVRWRHPEKGVIMPQEFVAHAEEYSLITQLDFYVLHRACVQARIWYDRNIPIPVAVNLCAEHFKSYRVVERIKGILEEVELPPHLLCLELRDSSDLRDCYEAHKIMASLHELGVKIALDNYGVGATSINYLRTIPLDYLKLDKSIVRDVNLSEKDKNLIKGMVDLAKDLNIGLVAEGVEDEVQVESLAGIGCDTMQGFYFCEPRDLAGFVQWVHESTRH